MTITFRRPKYKAEPSIYNSVRYASRAEASRAAELDILLKAGRILAWFGQITVRLGVPENIYRPDFLVIPSDGVPWFEDVKGFETPKFRRDKKLWKAYGRLELRVIRNGGVVETITP
jgi:hypothetical protein